MIFSDQHPGLPIQAADLVIAVQTVPGREQALQATRASLARAGVQHPVVVCQDPQETKRHNLIKTLTYLDMSGASWVLRLEDDVLVNKHLLHNICTWSAPHQQNFGAGWLWRNAGLAQSRTGIEVTQHGWVRTEPDLAGAQGILLPRRIIPQLVMGIRDRWAETDGAQDKAITRTLFYKGLRVYIHDPPLVEHNVTFPSTLAPERPVIHALHLAGDFDANWRRQP